MPSSTRLFVRFFAAFSAGALGLIGAIAALVVMLDAGDRLRAPAIANRATFDEKLRLLRREAVRDVDILLLGSSTTLHGVDVEALSAQFEGPWSVGADNAARPRAVNVGVQDLKISQLDHMAAFYLEAFPSVREVVMVSTMLDFERCAEEDRVFFDPERARSYLEGEISELRAQFRHLDLQGVLRNARDIRARRSDAASFTGLAFDAHGTLLLDIPRARMDPRIFDGWPIRRDPRCYAALRSLAERLDDADVAFTYVVAPMRPGYLDGRDPSGSELEAHHDALRAALAGTGTRLFDAHATLEFAEDAFFDAYHLRPDEARRLSREIGLRIGPNGRNGPAPGA